jgi:alpha-beta hydrolase superfamily lysophospholipase
MCGIVSFDNPVWEEGKGFFNKEKIRATTIPTLIIHAERDSLIPLEEARILYENAGSDVRKLVIIPGADHNTIMYVNLELYFGSITEFIEGLQSST